MKKPTRAARSKQLWAELAEPLDPQDQWLLLETLMDRLVEAFKTKGRKTVIHVNQHVIRKNATTGAFEPVLTVKQGKTNRYAHEVILHSPSRVVYRPSDPLSCGARVWIVTEGPVSTVVHPSTDASQVPSRKSSNRRGAAKHKKH